MTTFQDFGLSDTLNATLRMMNYTQATPIQTQAIPLALKGRDILGSAQTGTGKTGAFSIPLVEKLLRSQRGAALVLTPTRELAKQVLDVIHQLLGPQSPIKTAFIIGGEPMGKQFNQLRANPRIIVGTPGRINDHLDRGSLNLSDTDYLVLDETDRMLDMGFGIQLDAILKHLPKVRQTLLFSATLPPEIVSLASKYTTNAERISVGATNVLAKNIKTEVIRINHVDKYRELQTQLLEREGSVIIFIKTKHAADRMADNLRKDGFTADALHGDLRQHKRDRVMQNFRKQNFRILVATDIAARGLDVPHIEHVINYDMPQVAEDYIHRMGRTARAGAEGSALCFISPEDGRKWHAIERLLNPDAKPERSYAPEKGGKKKGFGGRKDDREWGGQRKKSFAGGKGRDAYKPRFADDAKQGGDRSQRQDRNDGARHDAPRNDFKRQDGPRHEGRSDAGNRKPYQPRFEGERKEGGFKKSAGGFKGEGFKSTPRSEGFREDRPQRQERNDAPRSAGRRDERSFDKPFERKEGGFKKSAGGFKGDGFKSSPRGEGFREDRPQRQERNEGGFKSAPRGNASRDGEKKPFNKGKPEGFKPARNNNGDAPLSRGKPAAKSGGKPNGKPGVFKSGAAPKKSGGNFASKPGGFKSGKPAGKPKRAA